MALELVDIHKHFGRVCANDGVTLRVEAGELHGLLGENGAGKSTLMKVLSGFHEAGSGEISLDGELLALRSPRDAIEAGIGMLHQDPLVFLPFTVLDNFMLGSGTNDRGIAAEGLDELSDRFGFSFDHDTPVRRLTVGERQQLEIARLLWLGARVLILDEPTTGISASQREQLFATLKTLAAEGMIVVFVSHKLEEIEDLCDRVTVMRLGKVVGETRLPVPAEQLVEMMFGKIIAPTGRAGSSTGSTTLRLDDVVLGSGLLNTDAISLGVSEGEIIGLAGLEGSGQRLLLEACTGLLEPESGSIALGDKDMTGLAYRSYHEAGISSMPT